MPLRRHLSRYKIRVDYEESLRDYAARHLEASTIRVDYEKSVANFSM